jgi:protein-arginine kinase
MGGCFIINNNILQAECDRVCAFVRGVLSHGNSVSGKLFQVTNPVSLSELEVETSESLSIKKLPQRCSVLCTLVS